jgi:hypothetical protein
MSLSFCRFDGVLVFNAGGSYLVAKAMHEQIKQVTKQRVKYVVLENSVIKYMGKKNIHQ